MVEQNKPDPQSEDSSKKVQIPTDSSKAAAAQNCPEEEKVVAVADENEGEEEEETKERVPPAKIVDQSKSNLPLTQLDIEDLKELLDQSQAKLKLTPQEK